MTSRITTVPPMRAKMLYTARNIKPPAIIWIRIMEIGMRIMLTEDEV